MTPPVGRTERLVISAISPDDARGLHAALAGPEVGRFLGGPDIIDLDDAQRRIAHVLAGPTSADHAWVNLTIRDLDGVIAGRLEATVYADWAEVAWLLGVPWWGRGLGTEAAEWLLDHLRDEWGVQEFWATAHPDNSASIAIMRRLGMIEQAEPYARVLGSWDPGDAVFARRAS